ncbi:MAG: phosphate/phosphite/phosphonate ABC transporter substrate-binding protein [Anaerolineaceae bacterium]
MRKSAYLVLAMIVAASMLLSACGTTATPVATEAPVVVATEAPVAWGTVDHPIVMAMAPSATQEQLSTGGAAIAAQLKELTGYEITVTIPNSYAALVEAMGSGNAQVGWLPPLVYMLAQYKGFADVGLVTLRSGSDTYGVQFSANVASGFTSYFDPATNKVTTEDAKTALAQFEGKKPCWTDPLSASGYVVPLAFLSQNGIKTKQAAFVIGHPTVITALYAGGICDFGATYIDARTSIKDAPADLMDKVVVIWRTPNFIPNDNVSFAKELPADVRAKIVEALMTMSTTDAGKEILKSAGYQIEGLKVVDDTFYDSFKTYLESTGLDITTLVK